MDAGEKLYIRNSYANKDLVFDRDGKLGIGTAVPAAKLSITDENAGQAMLQVRNFSTGATGSFGNAHSVELRSATSTTTHGVLIHHNENNIARRSLEVADSNGVFATFVQGKVGIGTATPNSKLMVIDTGDARKQIEFGNHVTYRGSIGHDASSGRNEYRTEAGGGMHAFFKGATSTTPEMIIDNNGKVGIGTATPSAKLDSVGGGRSVAPTREKVQSLLADTNAWKANLTQVKVIASCR